MAYDDIAVLLECTPPPHAAASSKGCAPCAASWSPRRPEHDHDRAPIQLRRRDIDLSGLPSCATAWSTMPRASSTWRTAPWTARPATLLLAATDAGVVKVGFESDDDRAGASWPLGSARACCSRPPRLDETVAPARGVLRRSPAGVRAAARPPPGARLPAPRARRAARRRATGRRSATASWPQAAGSPRAVRAVGSACATNPIPIVIPCHRVLRSDGSLGGYGGGLHVKRALLDLEQRIPRPERRNTGSVLRWLWFGLGWVAVAIGSIGIVVPGLPTTVFFIIAAACFSRSSPRFEQWVLTRPGVGPMVRDYRAGLGMPRQGQGGGDRVDRRVLWAQRRGCSTAGGRGPSSSGSGWSAWPGWPGASRPERAREVQPRRPGPRRRTGCWYSSA